MRSTRCSGAAIGAICLGLAVASATACGSEFPSKPVRIIAPVAPGGIIDLLARVVSSSLSEQTGQQFVVDNRPGANNIIGTDLTAKAPPDGYTILIVPGGHAISPSLYRKLPYDTISDFARVAMIGLSPYVLVASSRLGVSDVAGLIQLAKDKPGQISFSSSGIGNVTHLAGELLNLTADIRLEHVPYKGTGPLIPDLINGTVPVSFFSLSSGQRYAKTGGVTLLAVASPKRNPLLPNLPTLDESGLPGYEVSGWYGFIVPAATPGTVIGKLNSAIRTALRKPDLMKHITDQGVEIVDWTPAQFDAHLRAEIIKWRKLVDRLGVTAE